VRPRIVLSAPNFIEGGPLAVFQDALRAAVATLSGDYEIVAIVHRRALFDVPGVTYIERPETKRSWLHRLRFEFRDAEKLSRDLRPVLWLSMHDITPSVSATVRAVYCHNPAPFYPMRPGEWLTDWKFTLFAYFYRHLYRINIRQNDFVIVQQQWMREAFLERYPGIRSVIVAHPSLDDITLPASTPQPGAPFRFFYPAFPRSFKNLETILAAVEQIESTSAPPFELVLTVRGDENPYARQLFARFSNLRRVRWLGALPREQVFSLYADCDCLLFPSRLETWGMPLSEFRPTGKPMLVADMPYAHETVGSYAAACFLPTQDTVAWQAAMRAALFGTLHCAPHAAPPIPPPFAADWPQLFRLLPPPERIS
jgi:glycosyltransferase involved in cell wall biosynthesis